MKKRILSALLAIIMIVGLVPATVSAAESTAGEAIELGTGPITGYDAANGYHYIYYGTYNNEPIKWRVLDDQTNMGTDGLFVLSEKLYGLTEASTEYDIQFDVDKPGSNAYQGSDAQTWCNAFYNNQFTAAEQGAILATTKSDGAYSSTQNFDAADNILNGDNVFFLSVEEADNAAYGFTDASARIAYFGTNETGWWSRSPIAMVTNNVGHFIADGAVSQRTVWRNSAARPAFNLNTTNVAFVEPASAGATNEWKLNLLDSSRNFAVAETELNGFPGGTVSVNYNGAVSGTNEYVSAILTNERGDILYSGTIATASESGVAEFTVPADLAYGTYTLKLFNEQANGDKMTDIVSAFDEVVLTVKEKPHFHNDVTFTEWTATDSLPEEAGNYYLSSDVVYNSQWTIGEDIHICLNGHTVDLGTSGYANVLTHSSNPEFRGTLSIYDCGTTGRITSSKDAQTGTIHNRHIVNLYGGTVENTNPDSYAIRTYGNETVNSVTTVDGGSIVAEGSGIWSNGSSKSDGENNSEIYVNSGSVFGEGNNAIYGTYSEIHISGGTIMSAVIAKDYTMADDPQAVYGARNTVIYLSGSPTITAAENMSEKYGDINLKFDAVVYAHAKDNPNELYTGEALYLMTKESGTPFTAVLGSDDTELYQLCSYRTSKDYSIYANGNGGLDVGKRYTVTLPTAGEYTVSVETGSSSPVVAGGSFSFTVTVAEGFISDEMVVKANGNVLTAENGVYTISNIQANQTVTVEGVKRPHNYSYSVEGATITESCDCGCGHIATATIIEPENPVYDGDSKEATVEYGGTLLNGNNLTVTYTKDSETVTEVKNAGEYTASIAYGGTTASLTFTVEKAVYDMSDVEFNGISYTFDGEEKVLLISGTLPEGVTVTYENNKLTNVGSVEATANFSGDSENYEAIQSKTATLTITNATFSVTASGYDGVYDGKAHSVTVTADGATITYSTDGVNYSAENPEFTNAGEYTVYYKAVKANHNDVDGTLTVRITKATPTLTITADRYMAFGGGRVNFTVTGVPEGGKYIITSSPALAPISANSFFLPNETQKYVFTVTYAESENYSSATAKCTVSATRFAYNPMTKFFSLSFETNGGSEIPAISRMSGTVITLSDYTTERNGYTFDGWYADEALTDRIVSLRLSKNTTVYAGWRKKAVPETPAIPDMPEAEVNPFKDVHEKDWYYDDVMYVYENKLFTGIDDDKFGPEISTTRGMIVTILYRLEGEPKTVYTGELTDVPDDKYYASAVDWAASYGILKGYGNGKFGPEDHITREQMSAILYRYAKYKGYDVSGGENTNILSYSDFDEISEYAIPAMQWTCGEGIIGGRPGGKLDPRGKAKRSEVAAILHRFCAEYVTK